MTVSVQEEPSTMICPLLATVFAEFDRAKITYCLLRGHAELLNGIVDGDVDLLVDADHLGQMRRLLERLGFVALSRWGQWPHHFFIGYDESNDTWIKLDIISELAYGRPIPALRTPLAIHSLNNRVRRGSIFVLAAEDEFLTLLLHCLLDKGLVKPAYRARLSMLAREIIEDQLIATRVALCFPPSVGWEHLKQLIIRGEWETLLTTRVALGDYLAGRDQLGTRWRRTVAPLLRFLDRRTRSLRDRGLMVALLAPDGAGKTTLARSLGQAFYLPTRYIYMGTNLNSGSVTLPTTRWLARIGSNRRPIVRALNGLNSLIEQGLRYRVGAYHRRRGRLVVFDRYAAGSLMAGQPGGTARTRLRHWMLQKLCPPPDMVVYLDAPAEVLYQRKQEHSPESLECQRQRYLRILDGVAQTVIVDARNEPEHVRRRVAALIWRRYAINMKKG
jgi:thymidylate kinase